MAVYWPHDILPRLEVFTTERTWDSYDLLRFLGALPRVRVSRVVVLDNAGLHTSHVIRRARRDLAAAGVYLYFLPSYAPEFNGIEPVFRQVKYQEIPQRSHTSRVALRVAVDTSFDGCRRRLKSESEKKPRRAA